MCCLFFYRSFPRKRCTICVYFQPPNLHKKGALEKVQHVVKSKNWWDMKECIVERWWGGEVLREGEEKRVSKKGGVGGGANTCFLIKQQRSQLIHLICQLEEKHGRDLFTWARVGGKMTERRLAWKKSPRSRKRGGGWYCNKIYLLHIDISPI